MENGFIMGDISDHKIVIEAIPLKDNELLFPLITNATHVANKTSDILITC